MSKHVAALVLALLIGGAFFAWTYNKTHAPEVSEGEPAVPERSDVDLRDAVTAYLGANISTLSPEPAVLGGTFYVTDVTFPADGTAVVSYEDGHIALVADVDYAYTPETGVLVRSFTVRPQEPPVNIDVPAGEVAACVNTCGNGICEEVVCMGTGCPCVETNASCPQDCPLTQ